MKFWLLTALALLLAACAAPGGDGPRDRQLTTTIYDNGSKSFVYMQRVASEQPAPEPQQRGVYRKIELIELSERQKRKVDADMAEFVKSKGYCREGILVLERYYDRNLAQIRGECNETATPDDVRRFKN